MPDAGKENRQSRPVVVVECIGCKAKREIGPGEADRFSQPMCPDCFLPMVAVEAKA